MATEKTTAKPKAKKSVKKKVEPLALSWLPEKSQKQVRYFLERVCDKRNCEQERVIGACLAWVAQQSTVRHGIHRLVQNIELSVRCKI